ncbi:hypothetical protein Peur_019027 [Populus x canadensis]
MQANKSSIIQAIWISLLTRMKAISASDDPPAPPTTADVVDPVKGHFERKRSKIAVTGPKQKLDHKCTTEAEATPGVVSPPALKKTAAAVDSQRSKHAASGANPSSTEEETAPPAMTTRRQ